MIGQSGLIERRAVSIDAKSGVIVVQELWDTTAKDCPFVSAKRGAAMPPQLVRQVYMHRREAESLGLLPRSN